MKLKRSLLAQIISKDYITTFMFLLLLLITNPFRARATELQVTSQKGNNKEKKEYY